MPVSALACALFAKTFTPGTNNKAERFTKTFLTEWAYIRAFRTSSKRAAELPLRTNMYT